MGNASSEYEAVLLDLSEVIERDIVRSYGYIVGGESLRKLLGYPTANALHQAVHRKTVPIPIFALAHRWGRFALAKDIAAWLANCRVKAISDSSIESCLKGNSKLSAGKDAPTCECGKAFREEREASLPRQEPVQTNQSTQREGV